MLRWSSARLSVAAGMLAAALAMPVVSASSGVAGTPRERHILHRSRPKRSSLRSYDETTAALLWNASADLVGLA